MDFDESVVRFGTVDCTVHSTVCRRYDIRSYPTAMLINGTNAYKFSMQKTAINIVQFVNEARNPVGERIIVVHEYSEIILWCSFRKSNDVSGKLYIRHSRAALAEKFRGATRREKIQE